ncbi:hypothetical protein D3C86_1874020 [compost metagenome]
MVRQAYLALEYFPGQGPVDQDVYRRGDAGHPDEGNPITRRKHAGSRLFVMHARGDDEFFGKLEVAAPVLGREASLRVNLAVGSFGESAVIGKDNAR